MLNEVAGDDCQALTAGGQVIQGTDIRGWGRLPGDATVWCRGGLSFDIQLPAGGRWRLEGGRERRRDLNWAGLAVSDGRRSFEYRVHFRPAGAPGRPRSTAPVLDATDVPRSGGPLSRLSVT